MEVDMFWILTDCYALQNSMKQESERQIQIKSQGLSIIEGGWVQKILDLK